MSSIENVNRSKKVIFLVSGKAGSGKSTFAQDAILELDKFGIKANRMSFAAKLKDIASQYFGWSGIKDERGRTLLQHLGECGREYHINTWVNNLIHDIVTDVSNTKVYIIDDCRYVNEITCFEYDYRFKVIKINIQRTNYNSNLTLEQQMDVSENGLNNYAGFDTIIINNSDRQGFATQVKEVVGVYIGEIKNALQGKE